MQHSNENSKSKDGVLLARKTYDMDTEINYYGRMKNSKFVMLDSEGDMVYVVVLMEKTYGDPNSNLMKKLKELREDRDDRKPETGTSIDFKRTR